MRNNKTMKITGIQAVSAIYFALLQSGYDFYGMGRSEEHASAVKQFIGGKDIPSFFAGVKQNTCAVYPYWPVQPFWRQRCFIFVQTRELFWIIMAFSRTSSNPATLLTTSAIRPCGRGFKISPRRCPAF